MKAAFRQPTGQMAVRDATRHNLKHITVDVPTGVLTVVTGVAGAGKSTLLEVFIGDHPDAIVVDRSAISTSTRSVTATYSGIMDEIRDLLAEANGVSRSLFSFNSQGVCPEREGLGTIQVDLPFMDPVKSTCEACGGRRYRDDVLRYTWRGKSISDVLEMTVSEALEFFEEPTLVGTLEALDVGLGYLRLGQPLTSFSGGECQRIKLSNELQKTGCVYVLDEPTTGLHMADLERMLSVLNRLVEEGKMRPA
jgi:excinuclease UvrABC ATPase subunit